MSGVGWEGGRWGLGNGCVYIVMCGVFWRLLRPCRLWEAKEGKGRDVTVGRYGNGWKGGFVTDRTMHVRVLSL